MEKIESDAFNGCTDLTALELPEKLNKIGHSAFREDAALTSITIPAGVKEIDGYAFSGCSNLSEIYYYAPNCTLGSYVFQNCTKVVIQCCKGSKIAEYAASEKYQTSFLSQTAVKVNDSGTSYKAKKLKAKKKYFIQIRAYRIVDGKTVYGSWSAKKAVVTKK